MDTETTTTEAIVTEQVPAEASAEPKAKPGPLTLPGGRVSSAPIETPEAPREHPWSIDVTRGQAPIAHLGEGGRVRGSAADMRAESKRLAKEADARERQEREKAEEKKRFDERVRKEEEKARSELRGLAEEIARSVGGVPCQTICPICAAVPALTKRVFTRRPGSIMDWESVVMLPADFYLRKQKDGGALECPRCKRRTWAF